MKQRDLVLFEVKHIKKQRIANVRICFLIIHWKQRVVGAEPNAKILATFIRWVNNRLPNLNDATI